MHKKVIKIILLTLLLSLAVESNVSAKTTATGTVGIDFVEEADGDERPRPPKPNEGMGRGRDEAKQVKAAREEPEIVTILDPEAPVSDALGHLPETGSNALAVPALLAGLALSGAAVTGECLKDSKGKK